MEQDQTYTEDPIEDPTDSFSDKQFDSNEPDMLKGLASARTISQPRVRVSGALMVPII